MNNLKLTTITIVALLFATVGCNDLLEDPTPATSVPGEEVLTSEQGVQGLRASLYDGMRESFGFTTAYFVGPSAMADETRHRTGASRMQGLNEITGNDGGTNGLSSDGTYIDAYDIILNANLMISGVEDGVLESQDQLNRFRGEAYAIRALALHHMSRILGYEPGQEIGGWSQAVPLITTPTKDISDVGEVPRASNADVYSQILNDLTEAKTLLSGVTDNTTINEAFVDGLTARVNLYAGNWEAASNAADRALNNAPDLATDPATVANMFDESGPGHPEALFKLVVNPSTESIGGDTFNNGLATYTSTGWTAQVPTNYVIDLYNQNDHRLGWYGPCFDDSSGEPVDGCDAVNDEEWEIQKWGGEKGQQTDDIPYMRSAELYLIQAEASMKEPGGSYTDALQPINTLRQARGLNPLDDGVDVSNAQEMMQEILDERVRELVAEGHRFFDLKRLGMSVENPDGSTKIRFDSYRMLDNIGASLISANGELDENPGY